MKETVKLHDKEFEIFIHQDEIAKAIKNSSFVYNYM